MRTFLKGALGAFALGGLVLGLCMAAGQAQTPQPFAEQAQKLDSVRANLDQIEQTLARKDLPDSVLLDLRGRLEPLSQTVQAVSDELSPQLDSIKARVDQLGPKPAANTPPEAADVSAERADQQRKFEAVDAIIKRANLFAKQIEQNSESITTIRRDQFTRALFTRATSIADPRLWLSVAREAGRDGFAAKVVFGDWLSSVGAKLRGLNGLGFAAALVALALGGALVSRVGHRVNLRDPDTHDPSSLRKISAACWGALVDIATPVALAALILGLMHSFDLFNARMEPLATAVFEAAIRISFAAGVARAALAPGLTNWRPLPLSDAAAERIYRMAIIVAAVVSATKIFEAMSEIIAVRLSASIALSGSGALLAAIAAAIGSRGIGAGSEVDDCLPPVTTASTSWRGPLRVAVWAVIATIIGAALIGYNAFASFLVDQMIWVAFVLTTLFLLVEFASEAVASGLRPEARFGRAVINSVGLRRESLDQIAVLLSGAVTVALWVAAAMLILAPWGVESDGMFSGVRAAFFGFKVGEVTISLSSIIVAIILFLIVWSLVSALQNWLETRFLPHTQLDAGLRNSIRTSIGYLGFLVAIALALGYLGLSFDKLAIVAGALSVGIGFGLQSIVNNFVSGLILLWERAIRVGDWVVVGDEQGYVRRINVRSTEIETFDRAMMIVPNANLISGVVKNWLRNDRIGRIKNPVSVTTHADPEKVRETLLGCASAQDMVLANPKPVVLFTAMADNVLKFELICFVSEVESSGRIKSDLNFEILKRLREADIALFSPPTQVALADIERLEVLLTRPSTGAGTN